ncbi:MAG TPA: peptidoglycan DD-metalloendopeptidase family protein [Sphingomonadaceae bacterium]|nr:peptidoglycan DD-metalloendopeptidase family protein [Sphingomonadaceae bacterium]
MDSPHGRDGGMGVADGDFGGAAFAVSAAPGVVPEVAGPRIISRVNSVSEGLDELREQLSDRFAKFDLAPDLAQDIGSARWFRGVATLFGLAALSLVFWPSMESLEAAPPMNIDEEVRDEFRSQMIMPLALGGDTGRRMAATSAVIPLASAPERPRIELVATLAQGDSFARMLLRAGVSPDEAEQVAAMVDRAMPLAEIDSGTKVDIVLGRRPSPEERRPLESMKFRARFDLEIGAVRQGGALALEERPIRVDATPLRVKGKVGSSLYRSARAAGAPPEAVQKFLRTLAEQYDLNRAIGSADEFDMIIAYKRAATGDVEIGDLLYAGIMRGGQPRAQLMRWGKDGHFYEASGVGEQRSGLLSPVPGRVTSSYGMRRHPILGYSRMHKGLDFKAGYGTPIYAVTDGTVSFAGRNGGHGNYVKLSHGGGLQTGYSHMSRIAVNSGQRVRRGQVIGYVGSTGLSTGPHLHYEMFRNGQNVNPSSVQFVTRATLSGEELKNFKAQLAQLLTVEPGAALESLVPTREEMGAPEREIDRVDQPREIG